MLGLIQGERLDPIGSYRFLGVAFEVLVPRLAPPGARDGAALDDHRPHVMLLLQLVQLFFGTRLFLGFADVLRKTAPGSP